MAQTKIKAGLFEGIIGNGADGYFLMSNGDGTMAWSSIVINPTIASIAYPGSVTAADPAGGETITVTGTGFKTGATVTVGGTSAPAVSYVSETQITFTTPAKAAGDYDIVVTNTDTGSATYINGISYNGIPSWTTAAGSLGTFASNTTISTITLQAAEPDAGTITFNITNGALPTGLSLTGANIDGTTSLETADTLYTFTVTATDDESQATPRTFTITVQKQFISTENFTINTYTGNGSTQSIEGKIGTAASFNGSSSYVDLPSFSSIVSGSSANFSVSLWINLDNLTGNHTLFQLSGNNTAYTHLTLQVNSSGNFVIDSYGAANNFSGLSSISANTWYHVALVNTGSNAVLYLNNSASSTLNHNITFAGDYSAIGGRFVTGSIYSADVTEGKIDQVRIFNKALSSSEVTTLYGESNTSTTKSTTDIFDDGSGVALYEFEKGAIDTGGTNGYIGSGGMFNGSSSYINLGSASSLVSTNFTFSAWVKTTSTSTDFIVATNVNPYYSKVAVRSEGDGRVRCLYGNYTSNESNFYSTFNTINDGDWHHVVYFINQSTAKLYIDGSLDTTHTLTVTPTTNGNLTLASNYNDNINSYSTNTWEGTIDQVRIFNKELSSSEVTTLYGETSASATKSTTDIFNDGSGVALYEFEGNANDGTTKNPAVFEQLNTSALAYSENDTKIAGATAGNYKSTRTTESKTSGKYYVEMKYLGSSAYGSSRGGMGIVSPTGTLATYLGTDAQSYAVFNGGNIVSNNASVYNYSESSFANNDIIMFALDMDNQKLYLGKNNSWFGSDDPATGTGGVSISGSEYYIGAWAYNTSDIVQFYFKSSLQNYTAPTGFSAWSEDNFIYNGTATNVSYAYDGTPTNVGFVGTSFQPDLVWVKARNYTSNSYNLLFDSVRGATKWLSSNATNAEGTITSSLTSFDSNGFSLGTDPSGGNLGWNINGYNHVAWMWKAASSNSTNTDGSITSTVRANQAAGFSVVKYTGTGNAESVGHGLSSAPEMIIVKSLGIEDWFVYFGSTSTPADYMKLNSTTSAGATSAIFSSPPTSNVFNQGGGSGVGANNVEHIAYSFHSVDGYQKIGTYTGNGSSGGQTITGLGFNPRFLLVKNTTSAAAWRITDSARGDNIYLYPNSSSADDSNSGYISLITDGFRMNGLDSNTSDTYIYLAIA